MTFVFKSCNIDILTRHENGGYIGQAHIQHGAHSAELPLHAYATGDLPAFESEFDAKMFAQHRAIVWVNQHAQSMHSAIR